MTSMTLSFPQSASTFLEAPPVKIGPVSLRPASAGDVPFLRQLYRQTRDEELAAVGWPEAQRDAFCNSQFDLQHAHYIRQFPNAAFLIIAARSNPVGRLYIDSAGKNIHIIDISLLAAKRGSGIGSALLAEVKARAAMCGKPVTLHVLVANQRARGLYERLGFVANIASEGMHIGMRWSGQDRVTRSADRGQEGHGG